MKPEEALSELLGRLGASRGEPVLIIEQELSDWPAQAVAAMKSHKLLVKARPASSAVCPGCEQECVMRVYTLTDDMRGPASFTVCDKRDDINRVPIPASLLEQWQCSGLAIADLLANLLGLRRPDTGDRSVGRWEVGLFKGKKQSSHLVLVADGGLTLRLAGHSIELADVLTLEGIGFKLDKQTLVRLVDKPIAGAGDEKSATQRRARIKKQVQAEKDRGNKAFLKTVAEIEGISVSRVKQILHPKPKHQKLGRSAY